MVPLKDGFAQENGIILKPIVNAPKKLTQFPTL
jgi:hypothetical protein